MGPRRARWAGPCVRSALEPPPCPASPTCPPACPRPEHRGRPPCFRRPGWPTGEPDPREGVAAILTSQLEVAQRSRRTAATKDGGERTCRAQTDRRGDRRSQPPPPPATLAPGRPCGNFACPAGRHR